MEVYKTKGKKISGSSFREVHRSALHVYATIRRKTKRRPYVRSIYFSKNKVFLDLFWHHLFEKQNWRDRIRRVSYFECAIELIQKSRCEPESKQNVNRPSEILHRFYGVTPDKDYFCIQIKEDKRSGQKFLLSIFPISK